ncbi:hypothetical protein LEP1GSC058_2383 [Leptospira fainei serovar Hurstbridge str. BUT 6]|uniref:Alginate export domain-containing protein n=1 Tax=Leptospira fainei serovar Hurstbridge str. BUT 6 TaxID=1193011 RepID=S3UTX2_9LEPT|nr:hypothetical protein [Leptospira fainei]EPG73871.1 hypothetical protein LEP1GSC058_2383 [Leptospira fainei serovar Hurstbridge str. BUT 6]
MKIRNITKLTLIAVSFSIPIMISAEEIVTTKKDEPDGFYGLKVNGVVSGSYGQRLRDKASGISNAYPNDETGFSTPWTLLMINKEWKETGIGLELWGELLRASQFSADTKVDGGTKSNPYTLGIRHALIRKTWETNLGTYSLTFGMQELPHTYTQWKNYWQWRYVDKGPLESLGFAQAPADIGVGANGKWDSISAQIIFSNGEGYRQSQNTDSSAIDVSSRISYEPKIDENTRFGIHFFSRQANFAGAAGTDCRKGTTCLPTDNNPATILQKDIRALQSTSYAVEADFDKRKLINFGLGWVWRKQYGGAIVDRAKPLSPPLSPGVDSTGTAAYAWLALGWDSIRIIGRMEGGAGHDGVLAADRAKIKDILPGVPESVGWSQVPGSPVRGSSGYSSHASYRKGSVFIEWIVSDTIKLSFGYSESRNRDVNGGREKTYVDQTGTVRTSADYLGQYASNTGNPISSYGQLGKEWAFWTTVEF